MESSLPNFLKKIRPVFSSESQEERMHDNFSVQIKETVNESEFEESKAIEPLLEPLVELNEFLVQNFLIQVSFNFFLLFVSFFLSDYLSL